MKECHKSCSTIFSQTNLLTRCLSSLEDAKLIVKRKRQNFSDWELKYLEEIFKIYPYPDVQTRAEIVSKLERSERSVFHWFNNKRYSEKITKSTANQKTPMQKQETEKNKPISITPFQKRELDKFYKSCPYPNSSERHELARKLNLSELNIMFWFWRQRKGDQEIVNNNDTKSSGKKPRTKLTHVHKQELENYYRSCPYPNSTQREELARKLGLSEMNIFFWFKNRRVKIIEP